MGGVETFKLLGDGLALAVGTQGMEIGHGEFSVGVVREQEA